MEYKSSKLVENPLVSVFIFTYNQEKMVAQTINSILAQVTKFSFEIIIAEDCSNDNTKALCLEFFNNNPTKILFVANDTNKGLLKNYHESICKYARGKYIACCAGDDWWCDELKLQKQVNFLENNKEYDLIHTKSKIFIEEISRFSKKQMGKDRDAFEKMIVANGIAALTACFSKKAFLEYVGEIDPININFPGEDYPMWIWFSFRKKIYFLDELTTVYRLQKETLSNTANPQGKHLIEQDRKKIKMFFYNHFKISDKSILNLIDLKYYIDTMRTAALVGDKVNIKERNIFFIGNKLYTFYILSQFYSICGNNIQLNNILFYIERILRKSGITQKYYQ